jgi:uncharacterized C2H2 Zn-finger protein
MNPDFGQPFFICPEKGQIFSFRNRLIQHINSYILELKPDTTLADFLLL